MTLAERKSEFERYADGSIELGRNLVQSMLKWTEYIQDSELSGQDYGRMMLALETFYCTVQPINEKYIDGGES